MDDSVDPHASTQLFWFLTQRGAWDTWHLWCGGSNLELDHFCFAFAALLAGAYVKEMILCNPEKQRQHLWDGIRATKQVPGLGCPLVVDMPIQMEGLGSGVGRRKKNVRLVSYYYLCFSVLHSHRPSLCSQMSHVSLLLFFFPLHLLLPVLKILSSTSFALLTLQRSPLTSLHQGSIFWLYMLGHLIDYVL